MVARHGRYTLAEGAVGRELQMEMTSLLRLVNDLDDS